MKRRSSLLLLLFFLLLTTVSTVSGEVVGTEKAQWYLESMFILKTLAQLGVTIAVVYLYAMDIPISSIIGTDEGDEEIDRSPKARIIRVSQYLIVLAIAVGLLELLGKFLLSIQGTTVPGA